MEQGVNIITNNQPVIIDGAKELIADFEAGRISREQLYDKMLNLDVVYIDRQKFKDKEDTCNKDE